MLNGVMFFQAFGLQGGTFGNILAQWEQLGVFSYGLPLLLIFALTFGLLQRMNIFNNKPINTVIALSVSLMALQFDLVPRFFAEIFPKLGVALAIILIVIIIFGMSTDTNLTWVMSLVGVVIFVIIIFTSFDVGTTSFWFWLSNNLYSVIFGAIAIILLIAMMFNPMKFNPKNDNILSQLIKAAPNN